MTENETQFIFHIISWGFFICFFLCCSEKCENGTRAHVQLSQALFDMSTLGSDSPINAIYRIRARAVRVKMHLLHFDGGSVRLNAVHIEASLADSLPDS